MLGLNKIVVSICFALGVTSAMASEIEFKAPITNSNWKVVENTRLKCSLVHEIPEFGSAIISAEAGKNQNLNVKLKSFRESINAKEVQVRSVAPNYRPGQPDESLALMKSYKYFGGELNDLDAMNVISALEQSRNIAFLYKDPLYKNKEIQVTLNTINFKKNYRAFEICTSKLLPYNFSDVAFTIVNFKPNTNELTEDSKARLDMLITYLSLDPNIDDLVIDSYTDSFGTAERNRQVSKDRAGAIGKYIEQSGIGSEMMKKNGYGEKQHIMTNATEEGRNLNRRVVISVTHSFEQPLNYVYEADQEIPEEQPQTNTTASNKPTEATLETEDEQTPSATKNTAKTRTLASTDNLMKEINSKQPKEDINAISAQQGEAPSLSTTLNKGTVIEPTSPKE